MRRLALALAVVPFIAVAAVPALACKPAPPRAPETSRMTPEDPPPVATPSTPRPPVEPGRDWARPPRPTPPVNPWSKTDEARVDRLLDLMAAAIETLEPHKDSVQDAKAALLKAIALHKTTVADIMIEGKALQSRLQEQPAGFQAYMMSRMGRLQQISEAIGRLTPTQNQALSEVFSG